MCVIEAYAERHGRAAVDVVQAVYREYGFTWEAEGYHRDLYDIDGYYARRGGMFWAALVEGRVVGCAGVTVEGRQAELHRMYVFVDFRGRGIGRRLLEAAIDFARARGCASMIIWSDVKFTAAHGLYEEFGFTRFGQRRCNDPDQALEYGYRKDAL
jgi:putative acetyltransferase